MSHIRLSRTQEIDAVLSYLRSIYPLMSEAEIIKMVLSEKYHEKTVEETGINDLKAAPRKQSRLLSMAGSFKGAKDLSCNKKKYAY